MNQTARPGANLAVVALTASAIAGLAALLYWPIRTHEWVSWDDFAYITQNPWIAQGLTWESVRWALTSFHLANWFPLTWVSWMFDYSRHGFDAGTFLTTNLLLHALNSGLLFAALWRLSGSLGRSAFVAAVFAVHPLHVESVAWAAARKDVLSGLFFALALALHASPRSGGQRLAVAACFALGFAAKPTLVVLPFALLLLDDWPLGRTRRDDDASRWDRDRMRASLVDKVPLFVLALGFSILVFAAQRSGGTVQNLQALTLGMRLENAVFSYIVYAVDFALPRDLAFFYPHPGHAIGGGVVAGSALALLAMSVMCVRSAGKRPYLAFGWLWYLGTLLPVIGLIQVGAQARADRYMYLPMIGLAVMLAWGVPDLLGRWRVARARQIALCVLALAFIAALAWRTTQQIPIWRDSVTLYEHALAVTRNNHVAHAHLGDAYRSRGRIRDATAQYEAALRVSPDYLSVINNLAWLLATTPSAADRNSERALQLAQLANELTADRSPAVLDTLAAAYAAQRRYAEAVDTVNRAIGLARSSDDPALISALSQRLALYRSERPYREAR